MYTKKITLPEIIKWKSMVLWLVAEYQPYDCKSTGQGKFEPFQEHFDKTLLDDNCLFAEQAWSTVSVSKFFSAINSHTKRSNSNFKLSMEDNTTSYITSLL